MKQFKIILLVGVTLTLAGDPPQTKESFSIETPQPGWCTAKVKPDYKFIDYVKATMYHPVPGQTDDTPDIVADGTKFDIETAGDLKWIAVSRDLHKRWGGPLGFGDVVYISTSDKKGFYLVKDTMNKRFTKRIDFLESPGTKIYKYDKLRLYLVWSKKYTPKELWAINTNEQIVIP